MAIERIDLEKGPLFETADSEGEEAAYRTGELILPEHRERQVGLVTERPKGGLTAEKGQELADTIVRRLNKAVRRARDPQSRYRGGVIGNRYSDRLGD